GGVPAADVGHARPARPSLHHRVRTHGKRDPHIRVRVAEQATARDRHQPRRLIEEVLAGTQVTLRPVRADDEAKLMEIFSDPEVARRWGDPTKSVRETIGIPGGECYSPIQSDGETSG